MIFPTINKKEEWLEKKEVCIVTEQSLKYNHGRLVYLKNLQKSEF